MDKGMNFFYILSGPLGYVMEWIYKLLPSYGWDIIIFTLLINIVKIPLQLSQQKSMAKMSAFQPMMMETPDQVRRTTTRKAAGRNAQAAAGLRLLTPPQAACPCC